MRAGATVATALETMHRERVRHLPVVAAGSEPEPVCVGLLVESGLVPVLGADRHVALRPVEGFAHGDVPRVRPDDTPSDVARAILDGGLDAALVVDAGRLVGLVTSTDALHVLLDEDADPAGGTG